MRRRLLKGAEAGALCAQSYGGKLDGSKRSRYGGSSQKSPVKPTDLNTSWDSSRVRGRQSGERGSVYHALASCHTCGNGTIAPTAWAFARVQFSTCSSDRKSDMVAQVKPMSSYQRCAGTKKWTTASSLGRVKGSAARVIGAEQSVHRV